MVTSAEAGGPGHSMLTWLLYRTNGCVIYCVTLLSMHRVQKIMQIPRASPELPAAPPSPARLVPACRQPQPVSKWQQETSLWWQITTRKQNEGMFCCSLFLWWSAYLQNSLGEIWITLETALFIPLPLEGQSTESWDAVAVSPSIKRTACAYI